VDRTSGVESSMSGRITAARLSGSAPRARFLLIAAAGVVTLGLASILAILAQTWEVAPVPAGASRGPAAVVERRGTPAAPMSRDAPVAAEPVLPAAEPVAQPKPRPVSDPPARARALTPHASARPARANPTPAQEWPYEPLRPRRARL
jgi:hypothetical protein